VAILAPERFATSGVKEENGNVRFVADQVTIGAHRLEIGLGDRFWVGQFDEAVVVLEDVIGRGNGKQAGVMQQIFLYLTTSHFTRAALVADPVIADTEAKL